MISLAALILALLWIFPPLLRSWRMARFYQIEEYKSERYLRWLVSKRERWFPRQAAIAMLIGVACSAALQVVSMEGTLLHLGVWVAVCAFMSQPEPQKEIKKTFVRTPRAMRLLILALSLDALLVLGISITAIDMQPPQMFSSIAIIGFIGFLLAPLSLVLANGLLYPYEALTRRRFVSMARAKLKSANLTTIGITGSYGKTSTKTYLSHILNGQFKTYPTPKSFNTELGVSRAINESLDVRAGYQYFIAEMGAYVPGEIRRICQLTFPKISIVTAVGPMHLERFGTLENIVKAKYEIVEGLPPDGVVFLNGDDFRVRGMAEKGYPTTRILVSRLGLPEAHFLAEEVVSDLEGLRFQVVERATGERVAFQTSLLGLHNVGNILLSVAVARHLGMSLSHIAERVRTLEAAEHRLRVNRLANGVLILDDAYSANPVGARSALEALALHQAGRRIVITPGMVELGPLQYEENYKLGQALTETASDIVLVGIEQTQALQAGVKATSFDPARLLVVDTFDEARRWFQGQVGPGDAVLFLNDLPDTYL